jgi:hypothetical protein
LVKVDNGTLQSGFQYYLPLSNGSIVVGTTALPFVDLIDIGTEAAARTALTVVPHQVSSAVAATVSNLNGSYSNGTGGIGATLTANSNQAFPAQDGVTVNLNDRVLYKNAGLQQRNGVYTLTTVGDGSNPWVLTRATDDDQASEISGTIVVVSGGSTQSGFQYYVPLSPVEITVGTTLLPFLRAN